MIWNYWWEVASSIKSQQAIDNWQEKQLQIGRLSCFHSVYLSGLESMFHHHQSECPLPVPVQESWRELGLHLFHRKGKSPRDLEDKAEVNLWNISTLFDQFLRKELI